MIVLETYKQLMQQKKTKKKLIGTKSSIPFKDTLHFASKPNKERIRELVDSAIRRWARQNKCTRSRKNY